MDIKWYEKIMIYFGLICRLLFELGTVVLSFLLFGIKIGIIVLIIYLLW